MARPRMVKDLRCPLAVLLATLLEATLEQTAAVMGVGRATVPSAFAQTAGASRATAAKTGRSAPVRDERGRGAQLSGPLGEVVRRGRVLVVSPLRAALSQRLGRAVAASVVYRLLARHGWRKVAPDTRHPKSDPAVQEEWKKTARSIGGLAQTRRRSRLKGASDVPG
jgi:hypothetical protein